MDQQERADALAVFASLYAKRFMEPGYDALMRSAAGRRVLGASGPTRYAIEMALNALVTYADHRWTENTPLKKFLREVAMDAPAEVGRRMVNGFREQVLAEASEQETAQVRDVQETLLQLDDETLGPLLVWLARLTREDYPKFQAVIPKLSDEELERVAGMQPEELSLFLKFLPKPQPEPEPKPEPQQENPANNPPSQIMKTLQDELREANRRADEKLEARRRRREQK